MKGLEICKVGFCPKPFVAMDLPDKSQWDETTCDLAVCQHPQCWATLRRIEKGHPRILDSSHKSPLDAEDRHPVLTIVNIADSCFQAKRLACGHLSGFTFPKAHSLLSRRSKFYSKFQRRPWKDLPDRDLIHRTNRSPKASHRLQKLSVLNLNETELPCPQDVGNMDVIWIPEKHVSPAEKKRIIRSQDGEMKRKKSTGKHKSSRDTETQLGPPGMIVPPPSPVHSFEQLSSECVPLWNQYDMLPQELLKDLLLDKGKTIPYLEMQTQLAMMKKKPPLEKSRPDSAISAKMYLSVHCLTLQRPALRYPEHLKKLYHNLTTEGYRKQQWQQQRKVKTATGKQEAKKKSKSEPGSHNTSHKRSGAMVYDPRCGHRTLPGRESDKKQQQQMKIEGLTLKQDSTERPQMDCTKKNLDSFPGRKSPELSTIECTNKDIRTQMEILLEAQERTPNSTSRTGWNPELKLLRILQATDEEDGENQPSGAQSEESLEAQAEGIMGQPYSRAGCLDS
ncbi:uncharacterized protein C9orf43 homolog isoform X1 [Physeter macrocephalus]|uniref:Uncharacterized protein C9orf43 homolog isoform X1 n=2 Tax=Physeter macrocephalus TaxID=9755 RepID=A0A455BNG4_PHYMC|nr:uncharacterized protein C9orf43 homolog isoform X1 [Physeter catodon]|eukprot:XP_028349403.1 uncharacterized protein C9orf43 homolog isoform X1 [Physeter catodon]